MADVLAHQRRWAVLFGFTALVATLSVGGRTLALGVGGDILAGIVFVIGFSTGVVPFCYGVVFGREATVVGTEG